MLVKDSLRRKETVNSVRAHRHGAWEPEWIVYSFTAWAHCTHPSCKQEFALAGNGSVSPWPAENDDWTYEDYFSPLVCFPMPAIIQVPEKCPDDVKQELQAAFELFWGHPGACAGRLRVALECLLNHLGVAKRKKASNGKFTELTLHARIDSFAKREPTLGAQLMALKWLGNSGSHEGEIPKSDVLDAFDILEHSLGEIIGRRSAHIAALAKSLSKKHGR